MDEHSSMRKLLIIAVCLAAASTLSAQAQKKRQKLSPSAQGGKWGYWNEKGKNVIRPQFGWAEEFTDGLAAVAVGDRWGFIDETGKMVIEPQFDRAWHFAESLAPVLSSGKLGFIDKAGRFIVPAQFDVPHKFWQFPHEKPKSESEYEQAAATGKIYDPRSGFRLQYTFHFADGLALVRVGDKLGYIDGTGQFVIEPQFDDADPFDRGSARVVVDGKSFYIDRDGKIMRAVQ